MKKLLTNTRADGYIDVVVCVMAAMMVIVIALNAFSFLTLKQDMDYFAKEVLDAATMYGRVYPEVTVRYNELVEELGINPKMNFSGSEYYNVVDGTVQLGDTIKLTLTYSTHVRGLGVFKIPVTLRSTHSGLSQKYWK